MQNTTQENIFLRKDSIFGPLLMGDVLPCEDVYGSV